MYLAFPGCARVEGDEEEDEFDDVDNEFNFGGRGKVDMQAALIETMLQGHMSYGRAYDSDLPRVLHTMPQLPLLTDGRMVQPSLLQPSLYLSLTSCMLQVNDIPPEQHALVPSFIGGGGKRIHPLPFSDPNLPGNSSGLVLYFLPYPSSSCLLIIGRELDHFIPFVLQYNLDPWIPPRTWLPMDMEV